MERYGVSETRCEIGILKLLGASGIEVLLNQAGAKPDV
jgi:hypothetical protein